MTWNSFYLVCFGVGLVLSMLSMLGGFAHLHIGHVRFGHFRLGHSVHAAPSAHAASGANPISPLNGFTLMAFLCWFGGTGYLLHNFSVFVAPIVLLFSVVSGVAGAAVIWTALVKVLLPRERALTPEDTEMTGVVGRVSGTIRVGGTGEILFSQTGVRRSAPARSEDNAAIERGVEVVVMRYEHGIAYVRRWEELAGESP